ncbi:hypothetical protein CRYUN_Cryun13aG0068600 [Craigia yunnanensis]
MHNFSLDIYKEKEVDVNDDLEKKLAFYTQALEGTRLAFEKFQSMGLPFLRSPDYYAEKVKINAHMVSLWREAKQGGGKVRNMKNREFRNSKFIFGGRKGLNKQNTTETTNDLRSFNKDSVAGNKKKKR